jgi:hypothetical protein
VTKAPTKRFALYLDESGQFDDQRHHTVSLIGGAPTRHACIPGYLKKLQRKTAAMFDDRTRFPESMRTYFGAWREDVQGAPSPDTLLRLARDVAY